MECRYKVAGFATITLYEPEASTPILQCSEISLKSASHGGLAFFLFIELKINGNELKI
jgi:hypothetical protein